MNANHQAISDVTEKDEEVFELDLWELDVTTGQTLNNELVSKVLSEFESSPNAAFAWLNDEEVDYVWKECKMKWNALLQPAWPIALLMAFAAISWLFMKDLQIIDQLWRVSIAVIAIIWIWIVIIKLLLEIFSYRKYDVLCEYVEKFILKTRDWQAKWVGKL